MTFHSPSVWFLLLLLVVPLLWWRWTGQQSRGAITFSSIIPIEHIRRPWAVRLRWFVPALRTLSLVLLIVCLARPQKPDERTRVFTEGIAIQLVVDRSSSMLAEDFKRDGRAETRMDAVKQVVEDFVAGTDQLPGRPDDIVGLITFATFADSVCPLTLDHVHLVEAIRQTEVASEAEGSSTAIGDAVALAVERMRGLEERVDLSADRRIKSKVIILLTDGMNNAGDFDPQTAAELAAAYGIKVYTIGAGTTRGMAPVTLRNPITGREMKRTMPVRIDEDTLNAMAAITDAQYFRATDRRSLEDIYARIDEMERTEIEQRRYTEYSELALAGARWGALRSPPLLPIVFVLLSMEIILASTRMRRIP